MKTITTKEKEIDALKALIEMDGLFCRILEENSRT
jgi:hypothetical protein